jgi:hypothetical protein
VDAAVEAPVAQAAIPFGTPVPCRVCEAGAEGRRLRNVYLSVDMEGITGIIIRDMLSQEAKDYDRGRKLMTADAVAARENLDKDVTKTILFGTCDVTGLLHRPSTLTWCLSAAAPPGRWPRLRSPTRYG